MKSKIKSLEELIPIVSARRDAGKPTVVFTKGCFDLLHIGHIRYLQEAKKLGDLLIVGMNSDASVRSLGKAQGRPVIPGEQRAEVLAALICVDFVVPFDDPDPLRLIEGLLPNVLVKGGDWSLDRIIGRGVVEAHGGRVYSIPLVPDISTTKIIERIQSTLPQPRSQEEQASDKGPSATSKTVL
ncbi:MAG: D-glycero-beta-D-manno-heptose 1-phosphate adenylyltransferase [Nitrospirota bacterium]|nr:MAG: D-glycero-beta-D-manno-heptose 1-phosphate adenylyltransferase [Nitrospirota bacterium]